MESQRFQQVLEENVIAAAKAVESKLDGEIEALDHVDLDDLEALRARRLKQLKQMAEKRDRWISNGHGEYSEIASEKDFFSVVKSSERVVCHFYRENWPCKVLDKHMNILARKHIETRFVKIHAEKSPFLSEKLRIHVLPTVALVKGTKVIDYVVGFDELGGTDEFRTGELEKRLAKSEVISFEGGDTDPSIRCHVPQRRSIRQTEELYSDSE